MRHHFCYFIKLLVEFNGVPGAIRTRGLRIRNPLLYPAELRGQHGYQ